jgi:glutamyl-tRNA synthetase
MEITHVIRGEDHLSNTPKQVLIYNSLGRPLPEFIHLPMILGSDGQKLSKRHGSISIEAFKEEGFLSEAIINFIALLGWSYDEKTTVFSVPELVSRFSLEKINKRPARFDYDKLLWLNGYYIRNLKPEVLENLLREKLEGNVTDKESFKKIFPKIIPLLNERIKTLNEASQFVYPFFNETIHSKKTIFEDLNKADAGYEGEMDNFFTLHLKIIDRVLAILNSLEEFNPAEIEHGLKTIPAELDVNFRKIAEAVRLAVWGFKVSPPLFQTMGILGKEESLRRIKKYREFLSN